MKQKQRINDGRLILNEYQYKKYINPDGDYNKYKEFNESPPDYDTINMDLLKEFKDNRTLTDDFIREMKHLNIKDLSEAKQIIPLTSEEFGEFIELQQRHVFESK